MPELLCHLVGDYILQNHWMANTKTVRSSAALLHATLYALPFLLLTPSWRAVLAIWATHFVIDRFRLARYWVDFYGVGKSGKLLAFIMHLRGYVLGELLVKPDVKETRWVRAEDLRRTDILHPEERDRQLQISSLPYVADAPPWLGVWLLILVDNTAHLTINHLALAFL